MSQYYARAREFAEKHGLDPAVGEALIWQESRGNPNAISPAGAIGLGQVMPKTGAAYGYSPQQLRDPEINLDLSMRIAADNVRRLGLENGLAAYNGGEGRLKRAGYNLANMPAETQGFVPSILNRASQLNGGADVADRIPVLPQSLRGFNQDVVVDTAPRNGHFKSQNLREKDPEALAAIQDFKETQRAMLPLALASMMSSNRGQQNFGNRLYAEAAQGINPMKLANGYVMDDGSYITDQDPSAYIRAQAALQGELNDAANSGVLGSGTAIQIGVTENGDPIFKGKSPTAYTFVNGQPVPYTGGVGAKTGATPTEDENKAAGYYRRLVNGQEEVRRVLAENPNVATQSMVPRYAEKLPVVGVDVSNFLTSKDRQSVEAAQLDMLDAALTLNTGQAYTKEQLRGLTKAYFPQPGDDERAIETKRRTLEAEIESARIRAGRALKKAGQTPGMGAGPAANSGGDVNDPLGILGRK